MADGYDPRRSKVSNDVMEKFRTSKITGELTEVPGIGPAAVKRLAECDSDYDKVTNTYQLFGKFLMLKGPNTPEGEMIEPVEHTQKFWEYLKNRGITAHRSAIVKAVAERCATMFPGIYDANDYLDDEDEEDEEDE